MARHYCWLLFFAVAVVSIWAFPADEQVEGRNLVVVGDENGQGESTTFPNEFVSEEDEDDDDDDETAEDGNVAITDRHLRRGKPHQTS